MLGLTSSSRRASLEEAEKPFWISFSDLMTALMVLFLVVMAAALLSVTQGIRDIQAQEISRTVAIGSCMDQVRGYTNTIPGVQVREHSVDFGTRAKFQNNSSDLNQEQQEFLRRFVPQVLDIARKPVCQDWLKQIVVEGFASRGGTYLHNLNLSTQRSERVLCALLEPTAFPRLTATDRELIQKLFFAGGYSFNSTKKNDDESRRIELKLEFYALKEKEEASQQIRTIVPPPIALDNDDICPIDAR
jgi:outer membrane protein OmpA-like peptidoglycan-associated protein